MAIVHGEATHFMAGAHHSRMPPTLTLDTADLREARDKRWPWFHAWRAAFDAAIADPKMTREDAERNAIAFMRATGRRTV